MTVGQPRRAVADLPSYRPGKAASQANEEHGITNAIKLASNENPWGPVAPVIAAITESIAGVNRYADHRAEVLRARLADFVGARVEQITVGAGSVGLFQQLCAAYIDPGDEVVYPWLSFEAYPVWVKAMAGVPVTPPLVDHAFDLDAVADAVTDKTKIVILATPNNPTGTAVSCDEMATMLDRIPSSVLVLIDEAYREFADPALGDPVAELMPKYPNVVVSRTFSKAYGLAGLRVGYFVADPEVISTVDKVLVPFAVNAAAQAGALAALDALDEIQPLIQGLVDERGRMVSELTAAGWELPDAQANFVYLPTGERTDEIYLAVEKAGVVTRPFSGAGIRITVGTPEENDRALSELMTHTPPQ